MRENSQRIEANDRLRSLALTQAASPRDDWRTNSCFDVKADFLRYNVVHESGNHCGGIGVVDSGQD